MLRIGDHIGNIQLTEHLGEGGMGEVFAGRDEKLRREVAIKTLRSDRLGYEARARLLREARVLSQLDHPHICRLLEYIEGEPSDYLVLELIRGQTLRQALGSDGEGLREDLRWKIAEQVAEALVVAHGQGIVHRDLKPENVMITPEEEVKVLDFGLARSVESEAIAGKAEASVERNSSPSRGGATVARTTFVHRTEEGQIMGTLVGMSPEQAQGRASTPASDMYSFGLLLQELFTGHRPYPEDLPQAHLPVHVAAGRTVPMTHGDGDLVRLVKALKSLEAGERPSAAEALGRLRWIQGKGSRLRRLLAVAAAVALLLAGAVKYTLDLRHERNQALLAQEEAEKARLEAEEAQTDTQEALQFLGRLFLQADPWQGSGEELTVRELLELGRERVDQELDDQPRVRTHIRSSFGVIHLQWGRHEEAEEIFEKALDDAIEGYGEGGSAADIRLMTAILKRRMGFYEEAEALYLMAMENYESVGQEDRVAAVQNNLGVVYDERGEYTKAVEFLSRALEIRERILPPDDLELAMTLSNLALAQNEKGDLVLAEATVRRALGIQEGRLGPKSPAVARSLKGLCWIYSRQGRFEEVNELAQRALEIDEQVFGAEHYEVANSLGHLARAHHHLGEREKAEAAFQRSIDTYREALGPDHKRGGRMSWRLAELYLATGRPEEAKVLGGQARKILLQTLEPEHDLVLRAEALLADVDRLQGRLHEAEATLDRALNVLRQSLGENHDYTLDVHLTLASTVLHRGDGERARGLFQQALAMVESRLLGNPANALDSLRWSKAHLGLGQIEEAKGNREEARHHWQQAHDRAEALGETTPIVLQRQIHALSLLHLKEIEEARPIVEGLLAQGWRDPDLLTLARSHGLL